MKNSVFLILMVSLLSGCIPDKSTVSINFTKIKNAAQTSSIPSATVSSIQIINNQLVITGNGLSGVTNVKVGGTAFNEIFSIESKTATKIIANSIRAFSFDVSKVFNLIISDASASATFPIDFSLCNATLNGKGFNCAAPVADKDVLAYDAVSGTWKPRPASGLNYLGTFDASTNPGAGPAIQPAGAYYVISDDGTIAAVSFAVGDWLVSNGSAWQKIDNSSAVLSVFGRNGAITAQAGDYNLDMLGDISFPIAPVAGKVLKFDGTHWVAGDDLSGGGAGSVTTTAIADGAVTDAKINTVSASKVTGTLTSAQIADGTIVNADINAAAAIDYSKLNIPNGAIPYAKLNIADGDIPAAKVSGLPVLSSILAATITNGDATHAPTGDAVYDALALKIGTTGGVLTMGTISGIPTPVGPSEAANKTYVNSEDALKVTKAGDTMSGVLTLDSDLKVKGGANYVTVKGSATSTTYDLTLPANKGTNGFVLATDGNGVTSWVDVNSAIASLDTTDVAEGTNLYFTKPRVLATDLLGLNTGVNGPITAADTVLSAFGKMQYQVTDLKSKGLWDKTVNDIAYTAGNVSIDKKLRLKSDNANYVEILSPTSLAATYTLTLPPNDGNVDQVLKTNGTGTLSWTDITDTSVQAFAKTALPTCGASEVLKSNGTTFSCVTDASVPAFTGTANRAVATTGAGGSLAVQAVTSTELGYLTGVTSAIQTQLNAKEASLATGGTTAQYFRGDKTLATLNTDAVPELTNLYFTQARAIASPLTGVTSTAGSITAADTILGAFGKLLNTQTDYVSKTANSTITGTLTINSIVGALKVPSPINPDDAVPKSYVDGYGIWTKSGSDVYRSGGNVGIGTTSPFYKLDVTGTIRALNGGAIYEHTGVNSSSSSIAFWKSRNYAANVANDEMGFLSFYGHDGTGTYRSSFILSSVDGTPTSSPHSVPGRLTFHTTPAGATDSTERLRIDSAGKVGIGTTSPTTTLDVNGVISGTSIGVKTLAYLGGSGAGYANSDAAYTGGERGLSVDHGTNTAWKLGSFKNSSVEAMTILGNGNVGVGTAAPFYNLSVEGSVASGLISRFINNATNGQGVLIRAGETNALDRAFQVAAKDDTKVMTAFSNGKVGIGLITPQKNLHVKSGFASGEITGFPSTYADVYNEFSSGSLLKNTAQNAGVLTPYVSTGSYYMHAPSASGTARGFANVSIAFSDILSGITSTGEVTANYVMSMRNHYAGNTDNGSLGTLVGQRIIFGHNSGVPANTPATDSVYGIILAPSAATGTITNMYSLFLGPPATGGTVTNAWGMYQADPNTKNYFAGNVGIGTATPATNLHILGNYPTGYTALGLENTAAGGNRWRFLASATGAPLGANKMCIETGGTCKVNFDNVGNVQIYGTLTQSSDVRLKKDFTLLTHSLDSLSTLKGFTYYWKDSGRSEGRQIGLIAQDVEKVFPEVVKTDNQGFKSVAYQNLVAPIIEALKEVRNWMFGVDKKLLHQERAIASLKQNSLSQIEEMKKLRDEVRKSHQENEQLKKDIAEIKKALNKK